MQVQILPLQPIKIMPQELGKVFLGFTPSEQRKFIVAILSHVREKYDKVYVPCAGQFTLVKSAISAGYDPAQVYASDVSLFSSLLGYYYAGKPLSELPFSIENDYKEIYENWSTDAERIAYIFILIKIKQLREEIIYEAQHREDLLANMVTHVQKMAKVIANAAPYYRGLNYEIADIRDVLNCDDPRAIILCNPPAYAGGYEKMFRLDGIAEWNAKIAQFNYNKEAWGMYCRAKERQSHIIWYKGKDLYFVNGKQKERVPSKDIIFCKEYSLLRNDYWLSTKPAELKDCPATYSVIMTKHVEAKPFKNAKLISNEDLPLTRDTKVEFVTVSPQNALYYRDLFAHKLGTVKAEIHRLCLLNGKVFGVCGFHLEKLRGFKSNYIFETYGFNMPLSGDSTIHRVLMLFLTCRDFEKTIGTFSGRTRTFTAKGIRTTCLSKYRKVKSNNGLFEITFRERMPNGMYKIQYQTDWHEMTFADCITRYYEEKNGIKKFTDKF